MPSDDPRDAVLQWLRREDLGFDRIGSSDEYVLSPASRARGRRGVAEFFVEVGRSDADPDDGVGGPLEWMADRPR